MWFSDFFPECKSRWKGMSKAVSYPLDLYCDWTARPSQDLHVGIIIGVVAVYKMSQPKGMNDHCIIPTSSDWILIKSLQHWRSVVISPPSCLSMGLPYYFCLFLWFFDHFFDLFAFSFALSNLIYSFFVDLIIYWLLFIVFAFIMACAILPFFFSLISLCAII